MEQEEQELLIKIRLGEEAAFEKLFHTYYPALCLYAQKLLGDLDKAREVVQDVFVRLYEQREALPAITSVKPYLYKSVHNTCLNLLKQTAVHQDHQQHLLYQSPISETSDAVEQAELEARLGEAIQQLPEQCRRIFEMNRFDGKKNKEIAEELQLSVRTVETQISKALKLLRTELADFFLLLLLLL
ncbi:RNA polymerase sigma-70 factor [Pontibacter qinzhouensis]|uniref:RNA polymerase sigma-70 factor n=1 Tax=Pontibacter qinzhouensis TaxID=2603253 RepID=A0A5C8J9X6_9BACT|nr:RNA polymerase sigma-70 factor [Pontibacter qinzhouensis]TXK33866.1 RNA polymerase sigma-70 factor [Pontibacter qinzhouensis]